MYTKLNIINIYYNVYILSFLPTKETKYNIFSHGKFLVFVFPKHSSMLTDPEEAM